MAVGAKTTAAKSLLDDTMSTAPAKALLARSLSESGRWEKTGQVHSFLRGVTLKAAASMIDLAIESGKADELYSKIEAVLDATAKEPECVATGLLSIAGDLAGRCDKDARKRHLIRCGGLFDNASHVVRTAAALSMAATLKAAVANGGATEAEPTKLITSSLDTLAKANSAEESRTAACGLGAGVGAMGAGALVAHGIVPAIEKALETKSKEAAHCREAGVLAIGQLCVQLKEGFEPYSIPMMPKLVKLFIDKDKKVADAATLSATVMLDHLGGASVKSVIGALYEGMAVVGGGGRSRVECLLLAQLLAKRAPRTMGPSLPECIPLVMECHNDSNGKVQAAASETLPILCACSENAEVASTLKDVIILALQKPDTTLECIEEVLMTTFCNPMDGPSLAFLMPVLIRGIKDSNYLLVKKATTCCSNICALTKDPSDIAPFVPVVEPLLSKNLDHSSPDIREASVNAKAKLLDGAGDLVDPLKRVKALAKAICDGVSAAYGSKVPAEVVTYLGDTCAAMLEEKLGGVVRVAYFREAVPMCADWMASTVTGYGVASDAAANDKVAAAAVEVFKEFMPESAREILSASGDKDFALDIQNIILAFAGRVLLRKADVRFERGHRYGLVGQNGTGKTTLLNRLAAKDINGFPKHLRTWYIRHEVICDDGVDVRAFLKERGPEESRDDKAVETILDTVEFPEDLRATFVNSLSGGWKMKLSVALSIAHKPELLLLDEPTNHLDPDAVEWLTRHLQSLEGVTMAVVSHDYNFLDEVCTDITHYDNNGELGKPCKFVYYPTSFKGFQKLKPEVAAGLPQMEHSGTATAAGVLADNKTPSEVSAADDAKSDGGSSLNDGVGSLSLSESKASSTGEVSATIAKVEEMIAAGLILPMRFPDPGKPEGIRTFRKPIMTLKNANFKFEGMEKYVLEDVSATLTLGSRAVIVGGNGSGKSTCLKLLIGDLEAEEGKGEVWKHHNLRLAYVAQQSLHHLEDYVQVTPIHYIQERFRQGLDAEVAKLKTTKITDDDLEEMKKHGNVSEVVGRRQKGKLIEYEVRKVGKMKEETQWYPLSECEKLLRPYVKKLIANFDQKQQALDSGMAVRPITAAEILAHLADFGVDSQLAHGKIRQMSGGQRQRLVICAAFWSKPHVIALDEPTNYLDNDSVAVLTKALKDFKGAVVTVSENEAFVAEISNEKWVVEDGKVTIVQLRDAKAR